MALLRPSKSSALDGVTTRTLFAFGDGDCVACGCRRAWAWGWGRGDSLDFLLDPIVATADLQGKQPTNPVTKTNNRTSYSCDRRLSFLLLLLLLLRCCTWSKVTAFFLLIVGCLMVAGGNSEVLVCLLQSCNSKVWALIELMWWHGWICMHFLGPHALFENWHCALMWLLAASWQWHCGLAVSLKESSHKNERTSSFWLRKRSPLTLKDFSKNFRVNENVFIISSVGLLNSS